MVRRCERPGCGEPAELGYGIDPELRTVWIEPLDPARPERPGVLCRRHADSMAVPLRWTLDDRRETVPRLFRAPVEVEGVPRAKPARAPRARPLGEQLTLDDDVAPDHERATVDDAAEEHVAAPWRPVFDHDDDLDGLLDVSSPLLSRAFNGRGRDPLAR